MSVRPRTVAGSARSGESGKASGTAGGSTGEASRGGVDTADAGRGRGKVLVAVQLGTSAGRGGSLGSRVDSLRRVSTLFCRC